MRFHTSALFETERDPHCHFGITESILGATLASTLASGATAAGVGAETAGIIGSVGSGALTGGALGAATSGITGGNPLTGAFTGALTGGAISGAGPVLGETLGIGATGGDILAGAAAGTAGAAITGQSPLMGAATGGAGGLIAGLTSSPGSPTATNVTSTPATGTGGGTSAASTAGVAPAGGTPVDLTASGTAADTFGVNQGGAFGDFSARPPATGDFSARPGGSVGSDSGGFGSKVMGLVEKNPGIVLGAGALGLNMLLGNQPLPGEKAIQQQAGEAQTHASTLTAYQQSGTLPPGLESIVDQQFNAAKASVVEQFGQLGLGNSTMMTDKLNQLRQQKAGEIAQFADALAKQGVQWANLSAQEFNQLLTAQTSAEEGFSRSLGTFAAGLAGLRTGGSST